MALSSLRTTITERKITMSKKNAIRDPLKSSFAEKLMYGVGDAGGAILLTFPSTYLTLYFTDSVGLAAAFAGTMMLVCRIFDGLSDVVMGVLIDKTHTKWGKARPWFVLSVIPLVLSFLALFCMPAGLSASGQKIYASVTYFLLTVVFYTINNISYHAMLQRFSLSSTDRSAVSAVRGILCVIFAATMSILTPILIPRLGGESNPGTWRTLVLIWGGFSALCLLITAVGIKEKLSALTVSAEENGIENADSRRRANKDELRTALATLLRCPYFYLAGGLSLVSFTSGNMTGINYYYARDVLGDAELMSIMAIITMLPMIAVMPFVPALFNRFGKRKSIMYGLIVATVFSMMILINPRNFILNVVCVIIKSIGTIPLMTAISTLAGDIADYNQMRTGIRSDGVTTSTYSVGVKLGTGLGSAIVAWALAIGHYDGSLAVQASSAINAMIITFAVVPAVIYFIGAILTYFWDIEKYQVEVQAFMAKQKAAAEAE